jgi:hypothetical protein
MAKREHWEFSHMVSIGLIKTKQGKGVPQARGRKEEL